MSPKVTLYIKDEDQDVWSLARQFADDNGRSLSDTVTAALGAYVSSRDASASITMVHGLVKRLRKFLEEEVESIDVNLAPTTKTKTASRRRRTRRKAS
jgi:hypothetical protein